MRISDWSSDVCSSDLARSGPAPIPHRTRIAMTIAAKFEIEYLQYLGPDGKLSGKLPPAVKDAKALVPLLKQMLYVRTFDTKAIALQRTGKRSEEHTSELQSLMRISYAVFCLKKKKTH